MYFEKRITNGKLTISRRIAVDGFIWLSGFIVRSRITDRIRNTRVNFYCALIACYNFTKSIDFFSFSEIDRNYSIYSFLQNSTLRRWTGDPFSRRARCNDSAYYWENEVLDRILRHNNEGLTWRWNRRSNYIHCRKRTTAMNDCRVFWTMRLMTRDSPSRNTTRR